MKHSDQIALFLFQMKSIVEERGFIFVERTASIQFLADRGMTVDDLTEVILALETRDCFDGPEADRDPRFEKSWTVAEFSPIYEDEKLYLKLSIRLDAKQCKCLSVKVFVERELG